MLKRILTALVGIPLLLGVLLFLPSVCTAVLVGVMSAIAVYELLWNTGLVKQKRLVAYTALIAFCSVMWSNFGMAHTWAIAGFLLYCCLTFGEMLIHHGKLPFQSVAVSFVAGLLLPYLLAAITRIHAVPNGTFFVLVPFIMAFMSDSGAYFVGCAFGKHKLAPNISPNKTVEGAVGGILGAVIGMVACGLVLQFAFGFKVNYFFAVLYGIFGSAAAVFGDLLFSAIKRQAGIKDYGKLFPGHGGILDRFDSMVIVAPLAELMLLVLPLAVK